VNRVWRLLLLVVATASALVAAPVAAQEGTPTPGAGLNVTTRTVPIVGAEDYLWFTAFVLVFAAAALVAFLIYVYRIQRRFYTTMAGLVRAGHVPRVLASSSFATAKDAAATTQPQVRGPAIVAVGIASEDFVVRLGQDLVKDASWLIEPSDAATWRIAGTDGTARISVTAARVGTFSVTATKDGASSNPFPVVAIPPSGERVDLPFVGQDFGTVLIALILVAAVILLAIGGILGAEAVATFFGGLLGYIFGVARRGQGSETNGDNGAPPS